MSPAQAEALARRYLKLADVVLPSSLGAHPEMRWSAGPLSHWCAITFRRQGRGLAAAPSVSSAPSVAGEDGDATFLVRLNLDTRDGRLYGLYRLYRRYHHQRPSAPVSSSMDR